MNGGNCNAQHGGYGKQSPVFQLNNSNGYSVEFLRVSNLKISFPASEPLQVGGQHYAGDPHDIVSLFRAVLHCTEATSKLQIYWQHKYIYLDSQ